MQSEQIGNTDYRKMIPGLKYGTAHEMSDEQLKRLDRTHMLGNLCGALVHELGQPLAAILSNAQTARSILRKNSANLDSANLDEMRDIVDDIIADEKRAMALMHRLRDFFLQDRVQLETFDFNELINETIKIVRSSLVRHHVKLVHSLDPQLLPVHADRGLLQQVLLNLFFNAIEAMSGAAPYKRELTLRSENNKSNICLLVSDTGVGIPVDMLGRIFDPFFTTKDEGMGIGLSISASIAAEHGGNIKAFNNLSCGATFALTLPHSLPPLNS